MLRDPLKDKLCKSLIRQMVMTANKARCRCWTHLLQFSQRSYFGIQKDKHIMYSIKIHEEEEEEQGVQFPVPEDGILTLRDIQDVFPKATGCRYKDSGSETHNHILCRDGVFLEPIGGWRKEGRTYFLVKSEQGTNGRLSRFESYRQQVEQNRAGGSLRKRKARNGQPSPASTESHSTKLHIGRGHFKNDVFKKLTASSSAGGIVIVGPFPVDVQCIQQIRDEAFNKFQMLHRSFKKDFKEANEMTLCYPDGSKVERLPDGSREFTIRGYRDYLDNTKKYDRLRLYLVHTCEMREDFELLSDTESLPDPHIEEEQIPISALVNDMHNRAHTEAEFEHCNNHEPTISGATIDLTLDNTLLDNTLPIDVKVRFTYCGNSVLTGIFPQNVQVETMIQHVRDAGLFGDQLIDLNFGGVIMERSSQLFFYERTSDVLEVEITFRLEQTQRMFARLSRRSRDRLRLRRQGLDDDSSLPSTSTNSDGDLSDVIVHVEPSTAASDHEEDKLDLTTEQIAGILREHLDSGVLKPTPDEDPSHFNCMNISRYYAWEDFLEEVEGCYDFSKKIKVSFISSLGREIAVDEGGPRREFFRLILEALVFTSGLFEGPDTLKVFSSKISAVRTKKYYFAGYAVAASIMMGGQAFECLAPSVVDFMIGSTATPTVDEVSDYCLRSALLEMQACETDDTFRECVDKCDERFALGVDMPSTFLRVSEKEKFISDVAWAYIIARPTAAITQFMDGMETLGLLTVIKRNPGMRCLLENTEKYAIDGESLKQITKFEFSLVGSNRRRIEERVAKRYLNYVDEINRSPRVMDDHVINIPSLLTFVTGSSKLPSLGLSGVQVCFDHDSVDGDLPRANTCGCSIILPIYEAIASKEVFNTKLDKAILYSGGMHAI